MIGTPRTPECVWAPLARPWRTLVVDASPAARESICRLIETLAVFQLVGTGATGTEALALAETKQPDLVLLDFTLPGVGGEAVATHLTRRFPELRVILMSLYDTPEARRLACGSGAHAFVNKARLCQELTALLDIQTLAANPIR